MPARRRAAPSKRAAPVQPPQHDEEEEKGTRRHSKRAKSSRQSYAEPDDDSEEEEKEDGKTSKYFRNKARKVGGRKKQGDDDDEEGSEFEQRGGDGDDDDDDEEEGEGEENPSESDNDEDDGGRTQRGKKRGRGGRGGDGTEAVKKKTKTTKGSEKELWRDGAKLQLGERVVIKKPRARSPGETPYTDDTIHPNTMLFLADLKEHNERQWLKAHDADYRTSLQDFTSFLEKLTERISELDPTVPELPVKDIIFRIYRDVRFSKDQTPYKTHFSAAWSRTGKKGPYAAYYVQIEPGGGSFVGGGLWQPEAGALSALRRDIDRRPRRIKDVLNDVGMRQAFFGGIAANDKKTVKAFVNQSMNSSTALKKHPKGYDANHKDIELLRLRSFTVGAKLPDDEVAGEGGLDRIAQLISCMVPFISYLNGVVMPDETTSGSSEDDDGDDDDDDDDDEDGDEDGDGQ